MDRLHKRLTLLASVAVIMMGCGKTEELKNLRLEQNSADALANLALLKVDGTLQPLTDTNSRIHKIHVVYVPPATAKIKGDPQLHLLVKDPTGKVLTDQTQTTSEARWDVALDGDEGDYSVSVDAQPPKGATFAPPAPWKAIASLDITQPALTIAANIGISPSTGQRLLSLKAVVSNEKKAVCSSASLNPSDPSHGVPLQLNEDAPNSADPKTHSFTLDGFTVPDTLTGQLMVDIKCTDAAGNPTELIQPVDIQSLNFSVAAAVVGKTGSPLGSSDQVTFVRPGTAQVTISLIDKTSNKALSDAAIGHEQSLMRVFVTETLPASIDALTSGAPVLWTQPFASTISFLLPTNYAGEKTLYLSVLRKDAASGKENIAGTVALPIYVEGTAPQVQITSAPQFIAAAKGAAIPVNFNVVLDGTPLGSTAVIEGSSDGQNWSPIAATLSDLTANSGQVAKQAVINYPFDSEMPYRVRVRVSDLAGNSAVSSLSSNLVGRLGINLAVSSAERSSYNRPGSSTAADFTPWAASSSLCRQRSVGGQLSTTLYAPLILQNRGSETVHFYATSAISAGMGYRITADGQVTYGRFEPTAFTIQPTQLGLFFFPITPAMLAASKVTVDFDMESTGAYSTDNAAYASKGTYPSIVLQDKSNGTLISEGPFACDNASSL